MRKLASLALVLLLSGCWFGGRFYSRADLTSAIPPGDYRAANEDRRASDPDILRIAIRADGLTRVANLGPDGREDGRGAFLAGFVPMDTDSRLFVVWLTGEEDRPAPEDANEQVFLLLRREGTSFNLLMPVCDATTADVVRSAGGRVIESRPTNVCEFDDRASFESALRTAEPNLRTWLRLEPARRSDLPSDDADETGHR